MIYFVEGSLNKTFKQTKYQSYSPTSRATTPLVPCIRHCKQFVYNRDSVYDFFLNDLLGEWPSGLNSFRQVTAVKLGRVWSNSGGVTSEA